MKQSSFKLFPHLFPPFLFLHEFRMMIAYIKIFNISYNSFLVQKLMYTPEKMLADPQILNANDRILIGYYPLRGKAQLSRLLCEYLHFPYQDLLFSHKSWEDFKRIHNIDWDFDQLPFLKDGDTIVTQTYPMCLYLLNKANRLDLLGETLMDQIKIDTIIWQTEPVSYICTTFLNDRDLIPQVKADACQKLWGRVLTSKLTKLEQEATNTFFFKKLSLMDFYIYETFYFLKVVSPGKIQNFPKLQQIVIRFSQLPEIKLYQDSKHCVKEICPAKFRLNWRELNRENEDAANGGN